MQYYISDIHFRDQKVFDKCHKIDTFENLDIYEDKIISNWNEKVNDNDDVYLLGDIADDNFNAIPLLKLLKGNKYLVVGNHDLKMLPVYRNSSIFKEVKDDMLIDDCNRKVHLCHYPIMDWMEFNRGGYLIYGHIHNKTIANGYAYGQIKDYYRDKLAFNCGVDVIGYTPRTLDELIELKRRNVDAPYIN